MVLYNDVNGSAYMEGKGWSSDSAGESGVHLRPLKYFATRTYRTGTRQCSCAVQNWRYTVCV